MIRPLTIATFLIASGSGLYLYQSKHEVQMLDRTIEKSVRDTAVLREQSRLLAAEWTMLNDPERLRQFADLYLAVKPIAPSQFTSLADLDSRLPAPAAAPPRADDRAVAEPVSVRPETTAPVVADETIKPPPVPPPAVSVSARLPEHKIAAARPAPVEAQAQHVISVARAPEARPVQEARATPAPAPGQAPAPAPPQRAAFAQALPPRSVFARPRRRPSPAPCSAWHAAPRRPCRDPSR
jgi:hypothetical protein